MRTFFITGTDTDVGKTFVTSLLLRQLRLQHIPAVGLKPIASGARMMPAGAQMMPGGAQMTSDGAQMTPAGAQMMPSGLRNADALALMAENGVELPYESVNPWAFEPAIAPHIAAKAAGCPLSIEKLVSYVRAIKVRLADQVKVMLIEGAGGWHVPLNANECFSDLPKAVGAEVILVVAMRLGCINHALLSAEAIQRGGVTLRGWVANRVQPNMPAFEDNLQTLTERIDAPLLGSVPYAPQNAAAGDGDGGGDGKDGSCLNQSYTKTLEQPNTLFNLQPLGF